MCDEELTKSSAVLESLIDLDRRGGHFAQQDMAAALALSIVAAKMTDLLAAKAMEGNIPPQELVQLISYKLRVMCSHLRLKFDGGHAVPERLHNVVQRMRDPPQATSHRKRRRQQRLATRPHPFPSFRKQVEPSDCSSEPEPTVVSKFWNGTEAMALYDDGKLEKADIYVQGERGMVIARWADTGDEMELELDNSYAIDGCLKNKVTVQPVLKRPAARNEVHDEAVNAGVGDESDDDDAGGYDEGDDATITYDDHDTDACAESPPAVWLQLAPGHKSSMTVVVKSVGSKAQITQLTPTQTANLEITPTTGCEKIIEMIKDDVLKLLKPPVAGSDTLTEVRTLALRAKSALLGTA